MEKARQKKKKKGYLAVELLYGTEGKRKRKRKIESYDGF